MSALSDACKNLSLCAQILERAGYKRAEGLAHLKAAIATGDIDAANAAADTLGDLVHECYRAEKAFLDALDACRHAWETRGEEPVKEVES